MAHERLLHDAEPSVLREALDGHDIVTAELPGKHQTGMDGLAVKKDGTRAALALAAAFFGAGQVQVLPQHIDQAARRVQLTLHTLAVERKCDHHSLFPSLFSFTAFRMRVGSSGSCESSVPSASLTAAISAGAVGTKQASPMLLAPNGPYSSGCSMK